MFAHDDTAQTPPRAGQKDYDDIVRRLREGDERMRHIEDAQQEILRSIKTGQEATRELVQVFQALQGAAQVLGYLGKLAKPMAALVALIGALFAVWSAVIKP